MPIDWKPLCQLIHAVRSVVLTSHIRPDCDALGSELGMAGVLRKLGKQVTIVNGQATPPNLAFIDPDRSILAVGVDVQPADVAADLLMILDTSAWAQLGPMRSVVESFPGQRVIVDHHLSEDDLGAVTFKDTTAEATGRLVVEAADALGVAIDPQMATPLFAAVATDTGWFRFASATSRTYQLAARLLDAGASASNIYANLYERETAGRVRLRGVVLERIVTELAGRLAHTYIVAGDYQRTGALPTDTEDLVNDALEIDGAVFAVIFIEQPNGGFKISFRSRSGVACNEISAQFGGGGHRAAAGAFVKGSLDEVRQAVLPVVREALAAETDGVSSVGKSRKGDRKNDKVNEA
jgi:phosphoesterase RecJ-like protein